MYGGRWEEEKGWEGENENECFGLVWIWFMRGKKAKVGEGNWSSAACGRTRN
jgi:hypothetical protein